MITKIVGFCSILVTIAAFAFWNGSIDSNVKSNTIKILSTEKKVDQIHWYLIKRNNVNVPEEIK